MSNYRITDLSYLENIGMGDDALLIEMIELFLENTPESLRLMKEYERQEDWTQLAAEAHKFKPNLSYMGLERAQKLILEIEKSVKENSELDSVRGKIEEIESICTSAYSELSDRLDHLKG